MIMDVLSSCQITRAQLGEEGTDHKHRLKWYRCKKTAKPFPTWHAFGAPCWEPMPWEWVKGPGIYPFVKEWTPSNIPPAHGVEYHGKKEWYDKGIPKEVWDDPDKYKDPTVVFCFPFPLGVFTGIAPPSPPSLGVVTGLVQPSPYLLGVVTASVQPSRYLLGVVTAGSSTATDPVVILAGEVSGATTVDALAWQAGEVSGAEAVVTYTMALDAGAVSGATSATTDPANLTAGVVAGASASGTTAFLFPGVVSGSGYVAGGWSGVSVLVAAGEVSGGIAYLTNSNLYAGEVTGATSSATTSNLIPWSGSVTGVNVSPGLIIQPPPVGEGS